MEKNLEAISSGSFQRRQRRPIFVIASGVVLICPGLLLTAVAIAGLFMQVDSPFFALFFIAPFACLHDWLSLKQYCSLFCCPPIAARAYHEIYFIFGGLGLFAAVANYCEYLSERQRTDNGVLYFLAGIAIFGLLCIVLGMINYSVTRSRRKFALTHGLMQKSDFSAKIFANPEYKKRTLLGIFIMSGITALIAGVFIWDEHRFPSTGSHLSYEQFPYKNFPTEGTDFSYRRGYRGAITCEFTISEQGFRNWIASDNRWEYCKPIEGEVTVYGILPIAAKKKIESDRPRRTPSRLRRRRKPSSHIRPRDRSGVLLDLLLNTMLRAK